MSLLAVLLLAGGLPASPAAAQVPAAAAEAPATITVTRYELQGNSLLATPALQALLAPYLGAANLQRLRSAAAAVQEAYRDAGWGGVVAFLPEQTLAGGVVRIRVVEGRLARVDVAENRQFSADNVRASLPSLRVGSTPAVRRIDAEIQMANENPAKNIQVLLQPGSAPGEVQAKVTVQEQPVSRFTGRLDDTGGKAIGRLRAALGWQYANLWDADHVVAAEVQTAPEDTSAVKVFSFNYRAPLYGRAMALDFYGAWSDVDAGKVGTAAGDLQFSGKGSIFGGRLSLYLPRQGNVDQRVLIGAEAREYDNSCTIAGLPQAACGAAGASVSLQPWSLSYTAQAQGETRWGASIGLHGNIASGGSHGTAADFEAVRPGSKPRYTLLRLSGQWAAPLGEWASVALRVNAQATGEPLVPGEMFGAGGAQNVRGYEERELSGDSGATLSLELQSANLARGVSWLRGSDLRLVAFADAGSVKNQDAAQCRPGRTSCSLAGAGVGLRAGHGALQLRLDAAYAASDGTTTAKGDSRAHFALNYNF